MAAENEIRVENVEETPNGTYVIGFSDGTSVCMNGCELAKHLYPKSFVDCRKGGLAAFLNELEGTDLRK